MSSFQKLSKSDVTYVPYIANKQWSLNYTSVPNDNSVVFYRGKKENFNITGSLTTGNEYQSSIYNFINHLFYPSCNVPLLDTGSLMYNINTYQSASQYPPTGAYFIYDINDKFKNNFPTGSNSTINVLSINSNVFGSKILPYSFNISSSSVNIIDDGCGNLYNSSTHIGNIFYSQGIIVITNQSSTYVNLLTGSFSTTNISFKNEHIIYENEIRCIIKESEYNLSYNPTLISGSTNNGILKNFATGSDFHPYTTTIGLYNDDNELLMVAKLGKPIMISPNTDMTFVVKYDT